MAVEKETQLEVWLEENMPEPGTAIVEHLTFTAATQNAICEVQLSKNDIPLMVNIRTQTIGTEITDYEMGEIIEVNLCPHASLTEYGSDINGVCVVRNAASGNRSIATIIQKPSTATLTAEYSLVNGTLTMTKPQANGSWNIGITYDITVYYS